MKCWRLGLTAALTAGVLMATASSAFAWAPESSATVHPGVMTFTGASSFLSGASQCTSNFVFTDSSGGVYLGQAAHCSSTGGSTSTNGCTTKSQPLGTPVYSGDLVNGPRAVCERVRDAEVVDDAERLGRHRAPEQVPDACLGREIAHRQVSGL